MTKRFTGGSHLLEVDTLARVEGEGAMRVVILDGQVTLVELRIFEPPRFFEAFLRGRAWTEPPDITARICGICPVAYQMSSCVAIEDACGVTVPDEIRQIRRLLYCGEIIESHALHIYLLHAPDFLGYAGGIEMAADHKPVVQRGLRLKQTGNALMTLVGGRAVHPVNVRLGGFYRLPTRAQLAAMRPALVRGRDDALATVELVAGFDFPEMEQSYEYLALRGTDGYPLESGSKVATSGSTFPVAEFGEHITEEHVARSNALHGRMEGDQPYVVGPLARYTLCSDQLSPLAQEAARAAGLGSECRNPFRSIIVRAVELVYAFDEALRIIDTWEGASAPAVDVPARAGEGHGVTEAPRGLLYHRYRIDADGAILDACIVPPTAQNQASIEADLRAFVQSRLDLPREELTRQCEQAIRNYDPCISCATHFLDLYVDGT
ncbi:MAG: Ni/Fe hydrogenase subunit alpha [Dactylosporangium sp.]|nr:Ni/Fe hydrogenase subunit alpha [Dactylosporangium sp.]NNJ60429.1 Ni/Fe hydrogenase subunit alpha [Dactylosporangium sp.]